MSRQDESATWDDMDWGALPPDEPVAPPPEPAAVEVAKKVLPPPLPVAPAPQEERETPPVVPKAEEAPARPAAEGKPRVETRPGPPSRTEVAGEAYVHVPATVATLALIAADDAETVVTFDRDFTVGRQSDNDLVIRDRQVSGHHARLICREDGSFEIHDLDSSGGTFVNGEEVERRVLANGDRVEFSNVVARFNYIAGRHVVVEDEFEETLVFRRERPAKTPPKPVPPRRIGMLTIPLEDGGRSLTPVSGAEVTIGRGEENDLVIADGHVSGNHAKIVLNEEGEYEVVDLDSTCGTFVNGMPIIRYPLSSGDRITFGMVEGVFEIVEA